MKSLLLALSAIFCFQGVALVAQDAPANPREKIETAVPEMIRMLEKKEHLKFIEQFAPPKVVESIKSDQKLEEFAKGFGDKLAPALLKALNEIKGTKPEMSDDGKKATFTLKEEIANKKTLVLEKVEKYWYIAN